MYCCDNYEYSLHCPEKQKRLTLREMPFVRGADVRYLPGIPLLNKFGTLRFGMRVAV